MREIIRDKIQDSKDRHKKRKKELLLAHLKAKPKVLHVDLAKLAIHLQWRESRRDDEI